MIAIFIAATLAIAATPVPSSNPGDWAGTNDYPPEAWANDEEGVVRFELTVNTDGTPFECNILKSSTYKALDKKTCELLMARARFGAAGKDGYTSSNKYENRMRWRIPRADFDWGMLSSKAEGFCGFGLSLDGPGPTKFALVQDRELFAQNRVLVALANDTWAITDSDKISDIVKMAAGDYEIWNEPIAMDNGLLLLMDPVHIKIFANSNPGMASVYKGKLKIGEVEMRDFQGKYREFEQCLQREHQ